MKQVKKLLWKKIGLGLLLLTPFVITMPFVTSCSNSDNLPTQSDIDYQPSADLKDKISAQDLSLIYEGINNYNDNYLTMLNNQSDQFPDSSTLQTTVSLKDNVLQINTSAQYLKPTNVSLLNTTNSIAVKNNDQLSFQLTYDLNNLTSLIETMMFNHQIVWQNQPPVVVNDQLNTLWKLGKFYTNDRFKIPLSGSLPIIAIKNNFYQLNDQYQYSLLQLNNLTSSQLTFDNLLYYGNNYINTSFDDLYFIQSIISQVQSIVFNSEIQAITLNQTWSNLNYIDVPASCTNIVTKMVIKSQETIGDLQTGYIRYHFK